jgi:hypothetical protein
MKDELKPNQHSEFSTQHSIVPFGSGRLNRNFEMEWPEIKKNGFQWLENRRGKVPSAVAKAMAGQDGWKKWTRQAGCLRYGFQGLE